MTDMTDEEIIERTAAGWRVDRAGWPAGPWDGEPDRLEWRDEATGIPCLIVRSTTSTLCGYAAVPPGHPWHGAHYGRLDGGSDAPLAEVEVHGGLTFSEGCDAGGPICHAPAPGEPDDVWWLGFDCGHCYDMTPLTARYHLGRAAPSEVYRDIAYVRAQCARLAAQIKAADA